MLLRDLFRVLVTLLGNLSPNRVGAHKVSLAADAVSLGKSLGGQGLSKVPLWLGVLIGSVRWPGWQSVHVLPESAGRVC